MQLPGEYDCGETGSTEVSRPEPGTLYVVATPIGNLGDLTMRAAEILDAVDLIAAEDTRHTKILLNHIGVSTRLVSLHQFNERKRCEAIIGRLQQGENVALVSDAGTPLISDPGNILVAESLAQDLPVRTVPGASAVTAALSVCGLPVDRFVFEGFLPAKRAARRVRLQRLADEPRSMVFFESPRRLPAMLKDVQTEVGGSRRISVLRELTKRFESMIDGTADDVILEINSDSYQLRGEVVVILEGCRNPDSETMIRPDQLLRVLGDYLPPAAAAQAAVRLLGGRKNDYYSKLLELAAHDKRAI
ncbi:MAG: 16S rRNA (cytidine(1402)-2'-O)-methyltransferase [Acidiferrobacteraceae bacterium]|nr:16S rRNA (cytidine(1402)-2'-O)-methyltransferase [Acidiferrobacteraceae bacterium]|tara:strand:+ start:9735 stop:10646 length:912 start_codon:yes stop_codon:yes gene_type:complete